MEIRTRQIAACMNDDGALIGVEARREAVYDDGSRRVLDAEPATTEAFLSFLTGDDADLAAALATKVAELQAAAAINTALDAQIVGVRAELAGAQAAVETQAALIQEKDAALRDAERRAEELGHQNRAQARLIESTKGD